MDGVDTQVWLLWIIHKIEQPEIAHHLGREILKDKTLVPEIGPDFAQRTHGVAAARDIGQPFTIFLVRAQARALQIAHHRKPRAYGFMPLYLGSL